jgi:hypothetical protein
MPFKGLPRRMAAKRQGKMSSYLSTDPKGLTGNKVYKIAEGF